MVLIFYIVCFLINILLITCEFNITVQVADRGKKCNVNEIYNIPENENINIYYKNDLICQSENDNNNCSCNLAHIRFSEKDVDLFKNRFVEVAASYVIAEEDPYKVIKQDFKLTENITTYKFLFLYLEARKKETSDHVEFKTNSGTNYYVKSECTTTLHRISAEVSVTENTTTDIADAKASVGTPEAKANTTDSPTPTWVYVASGLGGVAAVTMAAQTAGIMYFKAKAAQLDRAKNLSERRTDGENDMDRYSTMPGQKATRIPPLGKKKEKRESKIYETVNIPMTDMPPEPPAITTLPRLPRNRPNETQTHLAPPPAMGLRGITPLPSPMMRTRDRDLPRPMPATPVSQRPPIPLPVEDEHYEDVIFEPEDMYEPPPILETQHLIPARTPVVKHVRNPLPVPPKPLDRRAPPDGAGTAIKPKPMPKTKLPPPTHKPVTRELDDILKKRRNVIQVPIQSIPEASTSRTHAPVTKPKPPPVVKKPVMPPPPTEESEPVYEENYDSSDEEWTYEPLKPIDPHIYNI